MELSNFVVQSDASVLDAAAAIDENGKQIVFICDGQKLLAVFTDSDLRRYILRAGDLTAPVIDAANYQFAKLMAGKQYLAQDMLAKDKSLRGIPIVNEDNTLKSIAFWDSVSIYNKTQLNTPVVIMAGGKGTRLAPYTNVLPKPLIPVGDKAITERIMDRFMDAGCNDFFMIVNHKKELIKAYFNESSYKENLSFVDEDVFLGTGGGLKLLEGTISSTFFMTNCDIMIDADYEDILKHHKDSGVLLTMVCALKKFSVPYGTIELDENGKLIDLIEKPEFPILTNTGFYVVEPGLLDIISAGEAVHITELIQRLKDDGKPVGVYPVAESDWMDMGQPEEHAKMTHHFTSSHNV